MTQLSVEPRREFTTLKPGAGEAQGGGEIGPALLRYAKELFDGGVAALSTLLNRQIALAPREIRNTALADLPTVFPLPWVMVEIRFARGFSGSHWLVFKKAEAMAFAQLMLGEEFMAFSDFTSAHEDAIREAINQMMGSAGSSLKALTGRATAFGPPEVRVIDEPEDWRHATATMDQEQWIVEARFAAEGEFDSHLLLTTAPTLAQEILPLLAEGVETAAAPGPVKEKAEAVSASGIDMILDIALPVTVELGRTKMLIRDILSLAPGSVIELDKLAGEPVDLLVNDKPIAKGEVVVIDENFGVRLTNIVNTTERIKNLR